MASEALTGLRFNPQSPQLLYTAALEGAVKLWDIRLKEASKPVRIFSSKPGIGSLVIKVIQSFTAPSISY